MKDKDLNSYGLNINKTLLRPDEAAEILNVSRYTIYRLLN
ncbi:MAG: helix-turn-helix domain-containing protein, partial [Nitrospirota bacterium]